MKEFRGSSKNMGYFSKARYYTLCLSNTGYLKLEMAVQEKATPKPISARMYLEPAEHTMCNSPFLTPVYKSLNNKHLVISIFVS